MFIVERLVLRLKGDWGQGRAGGVWVTVEKESAAGFRRHMAGEDAGESTTA